MKIEIEKIDSPCEDGWGDLDNVNVFITLLLLYKQLRFIQPILYINNRYFEKLNHSKLTNIIVLRKYCCVIQKKYIKLLNHYSKSTIKQLNPLSMMITSNKTFN